MTRDDRQNEGCNKWWNARSYGSRADMWGTLNHITGFGKTYETCRYIIKPFLALYEAIYKIQHNVDDVVLIVTPLADLVKQWEQTLKEQGITENVRVSTVQGLNANEQRNLKVGLVVIDELHLFYGSENAEVFFRYANGEYLKAHYGLGLTATPYFRDGRHKEVLERFPVVDTVTEKEAKEYGWIPKTNEYNLVVEMTDEEHNAYYENEAILSKYGALLGDSPFIAAAKILSGGYSGGTFYKGFQFAMFWAKNRGWSKDCSKEVDAVWNPYLITGYAKHYMKAIYNRMTLLGSVEDKLKKTIQIIEKLNVATITFSKNTSVADLLTVACKEKGIVAASYHSNIESKALVDPETGDLFRVKSGPNKGQPKIFGKDFIKKQILEDYKKGLIRVLNTVDAASTGLDTPQTRLAIILARGSDDNKHKQRTGRVKRFDPNDLGANMLVVNLYVYGTKDEQYVKQSQRTNKGRIVYSVEEINFTVPTDEIIL